MVAGGRVDGMGAVLSDVVDTGDHAVERSGYFGRSSTVNFVNQVLRICSGQSQTEAVSPTTHMMSEKVRRPLQPSEEYALPPRREADAMLSVFWSRIHPLYPFLDRTDFEHSYSKLWTAAPSYDALQQSSSVDTIMVQHNNGSHRHDRRPEAGDQVPESRRFHMLLNIMFALGCQSGGSPALTRETPRGELYWRRCKDLMERDFDIFNRPRLLFTQAMLYMGVYLQSTTELSSACWNIVGVAVRMSEALGLHCSQKFTSRKANDSFHDPSTEPEYLSARWRTWAGCVMIDRSVLRRKVIPAGIAYVLAAC